MRRMYSRPQLLEAVEQESKINGIKVFEDIKDKDGHPRFIEGDITITETTEGITQKYGKWSLSGSHLLIVVALDVANTTALSFGNLVSDIGLPTWIVDKIVAIQGEYVLINSTTFYNASNQTQNLQTHLRKSSGKILISHGSLTLSDDRSGRIQFDLLIDNE